MSYQALEDALLAQLNTGNLAATVDIEAVPETEADYEEPFIRPRISVSYQGSEFGGQTAKAGYVTNLATDVAAVDEFAEIHVVLRARLIRGDGGIYWLHEQVKRRLVGYYVPGWNRLFPREFLYLANKSGTWVYDLVLTVRRISVQDTPDNDTTGLPTLQNVSIQNTGLL